MANKDRQQNYTNVNKPQDYYEQEYQRQLDEFNRISGAGGQRVQQIDEGVNDFDDYYDAGYPDDNTQGTAQPYGQGSRSSSDCAGSYRESTPNGRHRADKRHVHRTDRASREVQASRHKAKRPQPKDEIMTCNLAKTIKAVTIRRTKKVKTKWKIKKDTL